MENVLLWLCIAFLVFVLANLLHQDWHLLQGRRIRTQGRIVGHRTSMDDGAEYHVPEVEYEDAMGVTHRIEDSFRSL